MKKQNLEDWFAAQEGCWDIAEPKYGHKNRFSAKIGQKSTATKTFRLQTWWKPLAIAASFLLLVTFSLTRTMGAQTKELAAVSPKMEETQDFFTSAIANELYHIQALRNPQNTKLINDAMEQMQVLETDYNTLKKDLASSGEDKRVIFAMIANFQTRIDLLKNVMQQLENTTLLNTKDHENKML